jgi:diguanylate cyclase (GGDEF)-like protein
MPGEDTPRAEAVNGGPGPPDPAVATAEAQLARLGVQIESVRALLVRLLQDGAPAERRLEPGQAAQLVEANAQLVEAALTSRAEAEAAAETLRQAERATTLDPLTGLPNRATLLDRFALAAAQAKRHGHARFALLFVDLDNFKHLNDAHGHAFGDQVMRQVADRLASAVREGDTVSRHGGDEFVVLLAELSQPGDAQAVAEKLIAAVDLPFDVGGHVIGISASIGIAIYPDDGEDVDRLIARADAAMYRSKRQRAGGMAFYGEGAAGTPAPGSQAPTSASGSAAAGAHAADTTFADRTQADLREANERLVLAVLSAQELRDAAEQARRRQAALVAAVAEELRNPAAPVNIASAILGLPGAADPLMSRVTGIIEQQRAQVVQVLRNVIDASSGGSGGLQLERRRVDMAEVIERAVAAYRPRMRQRGQSLEWRWPGGASAKTGSLGVQGDAERLEQLLGNLLDNACAHTPNGGRVGLAVGVGGGTLTIRVADDGIGISPQALPHVFEPFVQDTLALDASGVVAGVGLTVALGLARAHGGSLVAHSAGVSRGSQFVLTLPLDCGDATDPTTAEAAPGAGDTQP